MFFKKGELRLLWPFYLYYLIFGLSAVIMPFMIIYFKNLGFSFFQIAIITSTFGLSMFLFEIPTGAFADGYSRKVSVIIGFLITAISVILIPLMSNFYLLLLMWAFAGIGMTFVSGAEESWVVDNLNKSKRKDLHHEFFIKSQSLAAFGAVLAPFVGALLVKDYSIELLWFIFGVGFLINAILLMIFGKEYYTPKKLSFSQTLKETYNNSKNGLKFTITHKIVFLIVLAGLFTQLMVIGDNGWQPFLVNLGMQQHQLGYTYSIMAALVMVMPFLSRLFIHLKPKNVVSIIVLIRMVILFLLLFIYPPLFLLAAIVFIFDAGLFAIKDPIIQTYFHRFIPDNIRATVVSTKSMFSQLIVALTALIAGIFLDLFGPQKVLAFGSLFGIIAIIMYQKIND